MWNSLRIFFYFVHAWIFFPERISDMLKHSVIFDHVCNCADILKVEQII